MYTTTNYPTKAALKKALAASIPVSVQTGGNVWLTGPVALEGPHYPKPHTWYASAVVENGFIVPGSVK